jgi:hypothetical protein
LHYRVDDASTPFRDPSTYPAFAFFFSHRDTVHQIIYHVQDMLHKSLAWLHFVEQFGKILVINNSRMNLVTGVHAIVGLSSNGQQPAPGESLSPLFGGYFLRCLSENSSRVGADSFGAFSPGFGGGYGGSDRVRDWR